MQTYEHTCIQTQRQTEIQTYSHKDRQTGRHESKLSKENYTVYICNLAFDFAL